MSVSMSFKCEHGTRFPVDKPCWKCEEERAERDRLKKEEHQKFLAALFERDPVLFEMFQKIQVLEEKIDSIKVNNNYSGHGF